LSAGSNKVGCVVAEYPIWLTSPPDEAL